METSLRAFQKAMYREHLEDAAFLYDQRRALLTDGQTPWVRLRDFEERLEANIDALTIGGGLALSACRDSATDGEPGELYAAVGVYCRHADASLLAELWRALDFSDRVRVRAATEALKAELPDRWQDACMHALARGRAALVPVLSVACGSRRIPLGSPLAARLTAEPELIEPRTLSALARIGPVSEVPQARVILESACGHPDPQVRASGLRGLLCLGERRRLRDFHVTAQTEDWPRLALGLGGDRSAATTLRELAEAGRATRDTLLALGLLGDLSAVRALCRYLAHEELGDGAALALHTMTGAPLHEQDFVPEPIDARELLDAELAAWEQCGEPPRRADGRPFGQVLQRLSTDTVQWESWLGVHAARFDPRLRYRHGQPYSPTVLLRSLLDESTPGLLRALTYDELVIRYGCTVPFESDWTVADQRVALRQMAAWVIENQSRFVPGDWS